MLPSFRYHPDPLATGSVVESQAECRCCGRVRGYVYSGPVYAAENLDDELCPWCIADGSAAQRFDAVFADAAANAPVDVPADVLEVVDRRTVGFCGWQQEQWLFHCQDACAFLGPVGAADLGLLPSSVRAAVQSALRSDGLDHDAVGVVLSRLDRRSGPTAYLFGCLHCGMHLAYWDSS